MLFGNHAAEALPRLGTLSDGGRSPAMDEMQTGAGATVAIRVILGVVFVPVTLACILAAASGS